MSRYIQFVGFGVQALIAFVVKTVAQDDALNGFVRELMWIVGPEQGKACIAKYF